MYRKNCAVKVQSSIRAHDRIINEQHNLKKKTSENTWTVLRELFNISVNYNDLDFFSLTKRLKIEQESCCVHRALITVFFPRFVFFHQNSFQEA